MFVLIIILLFICPLFCSFSTKVLNFKLSSFSLILSILTVFQLFLAPLTLSMEINYTWYTIMTIIVFCFVIIGFIIFIQIQSKKTHVTIDIFKKEIKNIFIDNIFILPCMVLGLLLILFTKFWDHDATFYISLSSYFKLDFFTPNGLDITAQEYRFPSMYYVYSVFFANNIIDAYYVLNPMIYLLFALDVSKELTKTIKYKHKWLLFVVQPIFMIAITLATSDLLFISGGMNFSPQSLLIVYVIIMLFRKQVSLEFLSFSIMGISFFSSTGLLITAPLSIAIIIYVFVSKGMIYSTKFLYIPFILFSYHIFAFTNLLIGVTQLAVTYFLTILFLSWNYIYYKFFAKYEYRILLAKKFIKSKKYLWISSVLYILIGIFAFVWYTFVDKSIYFSHWLGYFSLSISVCLIFINFICLFRNQNKNTTICNLVMFIFIVIFITMCEAVLLNFIPFSFPRGSIWRLNFLIPGFGNIIDSIFIYLLLSVWLLNYLIYFKKIEWQKINNFILAFLFISTNIPVGIFLASGRYRSNYSNNIELNINKIPYSDISFLETMISTFGEKSYLTDGPFTSYIKYGVDVTSYFAYNPKSGFKLHNHNWNWFNFVEGIYSWNSKNPITDDVIAITPEGISDQLKKTITNFSTYNVKSQITHKTYDVIDFIILQNNTPYFDNCKTMLLQPMTKYSQSYSSDYITVFQKQ